MITQLFTWQVQESQRKIDSMDQELQQCNSRYTAQAREVDRLQTVIQERDLTSSQQETMLKSDIAEREEDLHRFKAEISVLHEKLAQNGNQVQKLHYICIADKNGHAFDNISDYQVYDKKISVAWVIKWFQ